MIGIEGAPNPEFKAKPGRNLVEFGLNDPVEDLWVFGYGSLMWNPGFVHVQQAPARIFGHHRAFAMASVRHRGTPERPGLVLTLCPGGSCTGRAFLVAKQETQAAIAYLLDREIGTYAYRPAYVQMDIAGERKEALTFLPTPGAPQFKPGLSQAEQARAIAHAVGGMGPNLDYLRQTIVQMQGLGLPTQAFEALEAEALALREAP